MYTQCDSIVLPPIYDTKKLLQLPLPQRRPGIPVNVSNNISNQVSPVMNSINANAANSISSNTSGKCTDSRTGIPVNIHYIHHHHYHHDMMTPDGGSSPFHQADMAIQQQQQYTKEMLVHPILPPLKQQQQQQQQFDLLSYTPMPSSTPVTTISSASSTPMTSVSHDSSPILSKPHCLNASGKISKPRKKKQCPECHLFFSNLSTHKSTHLSLQNRPFQCSICHRGFSRSNDLYRHERRHWKETGSQDGAYKCPFNTVLLTDEQRMKLSTDIMPCHSTGIFSRCDTYKNHLKALHFEYPIGTKKKMRNGVCGNCKLCGKAFRNVDEWLTSHVETGECHLLIRCNDLK